MLNSYPYAVTINDDGRQLITLPQFTWAAETLPAHSDGETVHKTARQLVCSSIKVLMEERAEIPGGVKINSESEYGYACVGWPITVKILLYREFITFEGSLNAFAKRVGIPLASLQRLLDPLHQSRWSSLEAVLKALDLRLDYEFTLLPTQRTRPFGQNRITT